MALGTDHITTATATEFIPEVWSREIIRAAERALVMAPLVKRYDADVSNKGDTIHIPEISNLTTNAKAASTEVTLQTVSESSQTISIDQHRETSFLVEDIVETQSQYDLLSEYTSKAKPTKTGLVKPYLITGTAEMLTRTKQAIMKVIAVQVQRLSDMGPILGYATVRTCAK